MSPNIFIYSYISFQGCRTAACMARRLWAFSIQPSFPVQPVEMQMRRAIQVKIFADRPSDVPFHLQKNFHFYWSRICSRLHQLLAPSRSNNGIASFSPAWKKPFDKGNFRNFKPNILAKRKAHLGLIVWREGPERKVHFQETGGHSRTTFAMCFGFKKCLTSCVKVSCQSKLGELDTCVLQHLTLEH